MFHDSVSFNMKIAADLNETFSMNHNFEVLYDAFMELPTRYAYSKNHHGPLSIH